MKYFSFFTPTILLSSLLCFVIGCGGESSSSVSNQPDDNPPPSEVHAPAEPAIAAEDKITSILLAYYNDLSQEQLDETQYFAPTLSKFFSSKNISRTEAANSIRKGFETIESRSITLDRNSVQVTPQGDGYLVEFKGNSTVTRAGDTSPSKDSFHNRVGFNKDFQIISYEAAGAATTTRQAPTAEESGPSIKAVTSAMLPEFRTARFARTHQYIHPKKGYYLLTHPGAVSVPFHYNKIGEMFTQAPWLKQGMTKLSATASDEALPDFDCGIMFSKEGTFVNECPPYNGISDLMNTLAEYELGSYTQEQIDEAKELEKYVTHALIDTKEAIAFYFGQIEGQWYLLVVDIASYDCSA